MANQIKVKRGVKSGLPTLNVGELALTTDTKEIFIGTSTGNLGIPTMDLFNSLLALMTVASSPNGIPVADAAGKISAGWIGSLMDANIDSAAAIDYTKINVPKLMTVQTIDPRQTTLTAVVNPSTSYFIVTPLDILSPIDINYVTTYLTRNSGTTNISLAIFDSTGTKVWDSGTRSISTTGVVTFNLGTPLALPAGGYYIGFYASTTNISWWSGPTIGIGANIFRHGTYNGTSFPASIVPVNIVETTIRCPWVCFKNSLT